MPSRSATSQTACTFRSRLGTAGAHSSPQPGRAGCRNRADPGPERAPQPGPTTHGHRHSHAVGVASGAHANPLLLRFLPAAWLSKQDETAGTAGVVVRAHHDTAAVGAHREHVLRRRTQGRRHVTAQGREPRPCYFPPPGVRWPGHLARGSPHQDPCARNAPPRPPPGAAPPPRPRPTQARAGPAPPPLLPGPRRGRSDPRKGRGLRPPRTHALSGLTATCRAT